MGVLLVSLHALTAFVLHLIFNAVMVLNWIMTIDPLTAVYHVVGHMLAIVSS